MHIPLYILVTLVRSSGRAATYSSVAARPGQTFLSLAGPVAHWDIEK